MNKKTVWLMLFAVAIGITYYMSQKGPRDGVYEFELLTTNDVHGSWFDQNYVDGSNKSSLFAVNHYVDSIRNADGRINVILVDAGDCLQGDNAPYYYNYVDTLSPHLFPRLVSYMKYDAVAVGNHDIETGHPVYDRVTAEMDKLGVPFLGGNAFDTKTGQTYFQTLKLIKRKGVKIAILGYTNPNMKAWLAEELWSGMEFRSLIPLVQQDVDKVKEQENPEIIVVAMHSGVGKGDGSMLENQGLDLYESLKGVDFLVCSHDHSARTLDRGDLSLINSGSHSRNIGRGKIKLKIKDGKVVSKELKSEIIPVNPRLVDTVMRNQFKEEYEAVRKFTMQEVGELEIPLRTSDAYKGMSAYLNLLHTLSLSNDGVDVSLAAPLTYNRLVNPGKILYNDLFTIYPFENQLFVAKLTGREIKNCLEFSYDRWINTINSSKDHVLKITKKNDLRNSQMGWSFDYRPYNFDSVGGLNYVVDVTKPKGERVIIKNMADGREFKLDEYYNVAMTSYRANGGGGILAGGGVDVSRMNERIVARYPEMRELLYDYLKANGKISEQGISEKNLIGSWKFVPSKLVEPAMNRDMALLFGEKL